MQFSRIEKIYITHYILIIVDKKAKSSKDKIDEDTNLILDELQKKSNSSVNDNANKLGCSRQKVGRIIKDLENNKTIWGYTAIVDDNRLNRKRYFILLKKASIPVKEDKINIVVNRELRQMATKLGVQLESSYFVNGLYDGVLCVTAENVMQVKKFIEELCKKLDGVYVSKAVLMEAIFPIERNGFDNPNIQELKGYFLNE